MINDTDELRRLLDERGVEWMPSVWSRNDETFWPIPGGYGILATELSSGKFKVSFDSYLTPAQAVEATLGRSGYSYDQWREISDAVAAAMEYSHDKAIEYPDDADPLWNLDEYVNRILEVAFNVDVCGAKAVHR